MEPSFGKPSVQQLIRLLVIVFFLACLALGLMLTDDYGVGWDEQYERLHGLVVMDYFNDLSGGRRFEQTFTQYRLDEYFNRHYGTAFQTAAMCLEFAFGEAPAGGCAIDGCGTPLPDSTLAACRAADAVFLGAVGGPRWDRLEGEMRPESGLLKLRKGLGLYANLRPSFLYPALKDACPLRPEIVESAYYLFYFTKDPRYREMRRQWGSRAQVEFFWYFQAQALAAALFSVPFLAAMANGRPFPNAWDAAGVAV